jgi:hypothetical protein
METEGAVIVTGCTLDGLLGFVETVDDVTGKTVGTVRRTLSGQAGE